MSIPPTDQPGAENSNPQQLSDLENLDRQPGAENSNRQTLSVFNVEALLTELLPEALIGIEGLTNNQRLQRAKTFRKISVLFNLAEGLEYRRIKATCAHGEFLTLLQEEGIPERDAQRAMQALAFVEQLDRPTLEALLPLDLSKFRLVATTLPAGEARQLTAGEAVRGLTFDDLQELPVRACEERIKTYVSPSRREAELQAELNRRANSLEIAEACIEQLEWQLDKRPRARRPASVVRAREESAALGTQALAALDDLAVLIEALHTATDLDAEPMTASAQRGAAASNVWLHLAAVQARCAPLLERMRLLFPPEELPASPEAVTPLDEDECKRIRAAREQFLVEHRTAKNVREQQRLDAGTVKRGRGRPRNT